MTVSISHHPEHSTSHIPPQITMLTSLASLLLEFHAPTLTTDFPTAAVFPRSPTITIEPSVQHARRFTGNATARAFLTAATAAAGAEGGSPAGRGVRQGVERDQHGGRHQGGQRCLLSGEAPLVELSG